MIQRTVDTVESASDASEDSGSEGRTRRRTRRRGGYWALNRMLNIRRDAI